MLDHHESRQLDTLADETWRQDPRFAAAFRLGRPRQPSEYRRRRLAILAVVPFAALVPALFGYWVLGIFTGWIALILGILCGRYGLDHPPRGPSGVR